MGVAGIEMGSAKSRKLIRVSEVSSPNLALFSLHSGPNGLEMPATPTNRGWINRVAAVFSPFGQNLSNFGVQLGELTRGETFWHTFGHQL